MARLGILAMFCLSLWGLTFPLAKIVLNSGVGALATPALRALLVSMILLPTMTFPRRQIGRILLASALMQTIPFACLAYTIKYQPAGIGSTFTLLESLATVGVGYAFLGERVRREHGIALLLCGAGIYLIGSAPDINVAHSASIVAGFLAILSLAFGSLTLKQVAGNSFDVGKIMCVLTAPQLVVLAILFDDTAADLAKNMTGTILLVSLAGGLASLVANSIWHYLVRHMDMAKAGILTPAISVFAILFSWLILGEALTVITLVGCGLVGMGAVFGSLAPSDRRQPADVPSES